MKMTEVKRGDNGGVGGGGRGGGGGEGGGGGGREIGLKNNYINTNYQYFINKFFSLSPFLL